MTMNDGSNAVLKCSQTECGEPHEEADCCVEQTGVDHELRRTIDKDGHVTEVQVATYHYVATCSVCGRQHPFSREVMTGTEPKLHHPGHDH